jgi:hypothetical protein
MRTIVLHIGYPKTGTTAVQWCLQANREALRRQNIYYPATGQFDDHSHNRLAFAFFDNLHERFTEDRKTALFHALASEIDACGCDTVVLSSELFARHFKEMRACKQFMDILGAGQLLGICFLRRQDTYLESLYKQSVWTPKRKLTLDVDAFLSRHAGELAEYYSVLSEWADFLGHPNLKTLVYEQAQNTGGCARRFFSLLGVEGLEGLNDLNVKKNTGISGPLGTEIMRIVNTYSELSDEQRRQIAERVKQLDDAASAFPIPKSMFSAEHREQIGRRFLESNQRLAEEIVHQPLDGFWFHEE